jgi:hypothetical protein
MSVVLTCYVFPLQDLAGHNNENGSVDLPVSDTSNNSNHSEDVEGNSGDILNDSNIRSNFLRMFILEDKTA